MCKSGGINECWLWRGSTDADGFGLFYQGAHCYKTHRYAYICTTRHDLKPGQVVLHRCNNKLCVNPHHLYVGRRNTARRGSMNGRAKLTEEIVRTIRRRHRCGETLTALAKEYGVATSTLLRAVKHQTWKRSID